MSIVIKKIVETSFTYEDVIALIHESFKERLEQGLNFTCSFMTADDYKAKLGKDGITLVAYDEETNILYGTAMTHIYKDSKGCNYAYNEYLAIAPIAKRKGIGSRLLKAREDIAIENNCDYVMSDTSVNADSSVAYHLKNGFRIIGFKSYGSTNYYSYLFRKQLTPSRIWSNGLFCKMVYLKSYIQTRIIRKKNGDFTFIGSLINSIIH